MLRTSLAALALWLSADVALAQSVPIPTPAPQPKTGVAPPPASIPARPAEAAQGNQSNASVFPFRLPWATGTGKTTTAFDSSQRALIERVNAYMTSVQTLVGDFAQVGPDGSKTEGKFFLSKPGRVRFEYNPPSPVELIADGQSLVVRDRKLATQDLYPLSQTPLRFLLADRIDLLRDTNLISVKADDVFVSVMIEEKHTLGGTHRLLLMFGAKDFQLRQWTVTDPQGFDTTIALYNIDSNKKLDPGLFKINYERMLQ